MAKGAQETWQKMSGYFSRPAFLTGDRVTGKQTQTPGTRSSGLRVVDLQPHLISEIFFLFLWSLIRAQEVYLALPQ